MIGRVLRRGDDVRGLLRYLFGPGKANEHHNPRLVAAWQPHVGIEPPFTGNGGRDVSWLTEMLTQPLIPLGERAPGKPVWHCVIRAAREDRELLVPSWLPCRGYRGAGTAGVVSRPNWEAPQGWLASHPAGPISWSTM